MTSSSEITGNNYTTGFCDGFQERNGESIELYQSNYLVKHTAESGGRVGEDIGDIDVSYTVLCDCMVSSLFPPGAKVQISNEDGTLSAGTRIFIELTACRGEDIVSPDHRHSRDPKLMRKIKFYETLHNHFADITRPQDVILFVYNGTDPVRVWDYYQDQEKSFKGGVVHFSRDKVQVWAAEERQKRLEIQLATVTQEKEEALREKEIQLATVSQEKEEALREKDRLRSLLLEKGIDPG